MAVHADDWFLLRDRLREAVGEPLAGQIVSSLPPRGGADLVTKDDLKVALDAMEQRICTDIERVRTEIAQATNTHLRWFVVLTLPTLAAAIGASAAVAATIAG